MATDKRKTEYFEDPPLARVAFSSARLSWLWLILRVWLGYNWVEATISHKIGNPAWVTTGAAVKGFWQHAIAIPARGNPTIAYGWYRDFLAWLLSIHAEVLMGKVIAYGELLVGIALILGAFVGIAAFCGAFMNWNFMMAGTASTSPMLLTAAVLLILAWKVGGYFGLDRYLLPVLGTPWRPGKLFTHGGPLAPAYTAKG
jgi:thiosulfate dehydrogenase (quinone) large subunit